MKTSTAFFVVPLWIATLIGAYVLGVSIGGRTERGGGEGAVGGTTDGNMVSSVRGGRNGGVVPNSVAIQNSDAERAPVDVGKLVRKAGAAMASGGMMNFSAMMKMGKVLETIPYEKIPEALDEVEKLTNAQTKQGMLMVLLGRWAEKDGAAALAYSEELEKKAGEGMLAGGGAKMVVLQSWGQTDPDAVWDWYLDQRGRKDKSSGGLLGGNAMALIGMFNGLIGRDPVGAFEKLRAVEDPQGKQMALSGMMQHIGDPDVQAALVGYLDDLPENERKRTLPLLAGQWMMLDPDSMVEFANGRSDDERRSVMQQAGQALLYMNPEKGAKLMLEHATDEDLPSVYSTIAASWASRDLDGAEEWVRAQPQGPELDRARSSLATTSAARDPETAMKWAREILDASMRTSAISTVYMQWRQSDADAADAALPDSGLSPEDVEKLLEQIDASAREESPGIRPGVGFPAR